jgi:1-deoxy-D-xylulose-5-phosphate reductoisomerase
MRVPIAVGLAYPERVESGAAALDFMSLPPLTFEPPDARRFPGLQLAYDALRGPDGATAVLNAANEEAVAAFLAGTIRFPAIHSINAGTIDAVRPTLSADAGVDELLALEREARERARALVKELAR